MWYGVRAAQSRNCESSERVERANSRDTVTGKPGRGVGASRIKTKAIAGAACAPLNTLPANRTQGPAALVLNRPDRKIEVPSLATRQRSL